MLSSISITKTGRALPWLRYCLQTFSQIAVENPAYRYDSKRLLLGMKNRWIRDKGLDHAVEKERDLKQVMAVKDMAIKEHAASLPLRAISERKNALGIRIKVSNFLKKYPNLFELFKDKNGVPCVRLSKDALKFDEDERNLYRELQSESAARLCKLLMMSRHKRIHMAVIDQLSWDLGLPQDYVQSIVPNYPDCFRIVSMHDSKPGLDLVWWNDDLAVSALEQKAIQEGRYKKGMPLAFPLHFAKGHDLKQTVIRRTERWQNLPYISPYQDVSQMDLKGDFAERRMVAVMHELLSLMIHKRAPRRALANLQSPLDLPNKFEKYFARYPGIFYQCTKTGVLTVILKEAYKRDELVKAHPLVSFRERFVHFMVQGYVSYKKALLAKKKEDENLTGRRSRKEDKVFAAQETDSELSDGGKEEAEFGETDSELSDGGQEEEEFGEDDEEADIEECASLQRTGSGRSHKRQSFTSRSGNRGNLQITRSGRSENRANLKSTWSGRSHKSQSFTPSSGNRVNLQRDNESYPGNRAEASRNDSDTFRAHGWQKQGFNAPRRESSRKYARAGKDSMLVTRTQITRSGRSENRANLKNTWSGRSHKSQSFTPSSGNRANLQRDNESYPGNRAEASRNDSDTFRAHGWQKQGFNAPRRGSSRKYARADKDSMLVTRTQSTKSSSSRRLT